MSFKAVLKLGDKTFDLKECSWTLIQKKNLLGLPESGVTGGFIKFILATSDDDTFSQWISNPKKTENGSVTLYRIDQESKLKTLSFQNAYLINLVESFVANNEWEPHHWEEDHLESDDDMRGTYKMIMDTQLRNNIAYLRFCRISAEKITLDGIDHDNRW